MTMTTSQGKARAMGGGGCPTRVRAVAAATGQRRIGTPEHTTASPTAIRANCRAEIHEQTHETAVVLRVATAAGEMTASTTTGHVGWMMSARARLGVGRRERTALKAAPRADRRPPVEPAMMI